MRRVIQEILETAGIEVNGNRPWDLQLHDKRLWRRMMCSGDIGFGDAYMDGWWDCEAIDELVHRIMMVISTRERRPWMVTIPGYLMGKLCNLQSLARAFQVGEKHYDIGNELYQAMLDERMVYSCGYWQAGAETLDQAQVDKLELVCRKVGLQAGMRVLDIGCGWGSFCRYAAEKYQVKVVGLTVSREQAELTRDQLKDFPVEILLQDYRTYRGEFDAIISIGMFEHVGRKNFETYMDMVRECLKPNGLFLLHTIGGNVTRVSGRTWLAKHIFPNGYIPSMAQISKAVEQRFVVEDLHNFGPDYDLTLMCWYRNFAKAWPELKESKPQYTERFYRMWRFYLLCCAGLFRTRNVQAWQWVLSPKGMAGSYNRPVLKSREQTL